MKAYPHQSPFLALAIGTLLVFGVCLPGCSSNAPSSSPRPALPDPPITWDEASRSNDLGQYRRYTEAHPGEHVPELRMLADRYLRGKVAEAEGQGRKADHNATGLPYVFLVNGATISVASALHMKSGYFLSDPTAPLTFRGTDTGTTYVRGKGIAVYTATDSPDNTVYCFGF